MHQVRRLGRAAGSALDLRARRRSRQAARTAELVYKLEEAQRIAGFGSWEIDAATGGVTWSGQLCRLLGVASSPVSVADVLRHVHPDDTATAARLYDQVVTGGRPFASQLRMVRGTPGAGAVIDVVCNGEAIRGADGAVVAAWGTIQDITTQRAAIRSAHAADQRARQARAELEAEHRLLQMFQRAMLPARLPVQPGADLAAAYLPLGERLDIGGDWYDAFVLPDGRLAIAVGDVTGHDLRAAMIMGQVRNAVRAYAVEDPRLGEVMRRANALLATMDDLDLLTMLFGVYDPARHTVVWSRAGHPPPLLRPAADPAATRVLDATAGMLLGVVDEGTPYREGQLELAPGDAVLWFTDGLVERRDGETGPAEAVSYLCALVDAVGEYQTASELVDTVVAGMFTHAPQEDDVCLLALQRPHLPAHIAASPTRAGMHATT